MTTLNVFAKRNVTTTGVAAASRAEMNSIFVNYEAAISNAQVSNLEYTKEQALRMNVIALFRNKVDEVTKTAINVGILTIESVILRGLARKAIELRATGIEGTAQETIEVEKLLKQFMNAKVVESGFGSGVRYTSVYENAKNKMLAEYANTSNVIVEGDVYANIKMMLYKTGDQQSRLFNDRIMDMDFSCATIADVISLVMDGQHISRLIQETSIDMDKKHTLTIDFTLGRILNKELKAAVSALKKNIRRNADGEYVEIVKSNAAQVRHNKAEDFAMEIDLGEELVEDESVVTSKAIMEGAVAQVNDKFMPLLKSSSTLQIVVDACDFATKNYNDAVQISKLYDMYNSYMISTSMTVGSDRNSEQVVLEDTTRTVQAIKNSIIKIKEVGGYSNQEFVKLIWGASCKTKLADAFGKERPAFVATEEKEYARRLFRDQILSLYATASLDGSSVEGTKIPSDAVTVLPTLSLVDRFENNSELMLEVEFNGYDVVDTNTGEEIARTTMKLSGEGVIGMDNNKIKAVKMITLTNEFVAEGEELIAPITMLNSEEAMVIRYRGIETDAVVALEKEIESAVKLFRTTIDHKLAIVNNYCKTDCNLGPAMKVRLKDTNSRGNIDYKEQQGLDSAVIVAGQAPYAALDLDNTMKLALYYDLESAKASHNIGKTDSARLTSALATAEAWSPVVVKDVKHFGGRAALIFKKA